MPLIYCGVVFEPKLLDASIFIGRFGMGRFTTVEEVDYTADRIIYNVKRLRDMRYQSDILPSLYVNIEFIFESIS